MTIDELNTVRETKELIDELELYIEGLKSTYIQPSTSNGSSRQKTRKGSIIEHILVKIETLEVELAKLVEVFKSQQLELHTKIIRDFDKPYRQVLMYRYVECLPYELIAKILGFSLRHVYRLHKTALSKL